MCLSVQGGWVCPVPGLFWEGWVYLMPGPWEGMSRGGYLQGLGTPEGEGWVYQRAGAGHSRGEVYQREVGTPEGGGEREWVRMDTPSDMGSGIPSAPVLTPSGGHHNMYGWHADGMHPTGMLSCFRLCSRKGGEG